MDTVFVGLRVLVSLGAVLAVIWYAHRRITKGKGPIKTVKPITVVSRQGIGAKASVVIIEADGRRLLLGVTEHSVNVLSESEAITPVVEEFSSYLETARGAEDSVPHTPAFSGGSSSAPASQGMLSGSILSAETWKRSWVALRQGPEK